MGIRKSCKLGFYKGKATISKMTGKNLLKSASISNPLANLGMITLSMIIQGINNLK